MKRSLLLHLKTTLCDTGDTGAQITGSVLFLYSFQYPRMSSVAGPSVFILIPSPSVLCDPVLTPRRSSGTASKTLPHWDRTTGSEDQGLSKWVIFRSVYTGATTEYWIPSLESLIVILIVHCFYLLSVLFLGSLSALVYQHSITPISLPCALRIPEKG